MSRAVVTKLNLNKISRAVTASVVAALWFPVVSAAVTTHEIRVLADGTFSRQTTTIFPGDSVRFIMHDVRDSVIPALGVEPMSLTPAQFGAQVKREIATYAEFAKAAGLKPN